jgi:hypothetical protein
MGMVSRTGLVHAGRYAHMPAANALQHRNNTFCLHVSCYDLVLAHSTCHASMAAATCSTSQAWPGLAETSPATLAILACSKQLASSLSCCNHCRTLLMHSPQPWLCASILGHACGCCARAACATPADACNMRWSHGQAHTAHCLGRSGTRCFGLLLLIGMTEAQLAGTAVSVPHRALYHLHSCLQHSVLSKCLRVLVLCSSVHCTPSR